MSGVRWPVPCTPNQLMVARLQEQGYVANVPFLLRASGRLDADILREALQCVVERHDILRSAYGSAAGTPVMLRPAPCRVALRLRDMSDIPGAIASIRQECGADCRTPFTAEATPRLRLTVYRLAPQDHLIALIVDHLAADGLSLGLLGAEWRAVYQSIESGLPRTLTPNVPQYREFAARQAEWLRGAEADDHRRWWAAQLGGYSSGGSSLSGDGLRQASAADFSLGPEAARRISALCTRYRLTPFMVILVAYAVLLASLDGERDLLVATVRANRREPVARTTIGHFANLVPLRISLDLAGDGAELLRTAGTMCRASYGHDALPFQDIAKVAATQLGLPPARLARYAINFIPFSEAPEIWAPNLRLSQQWGLLDRQPLATGRVSLFVRQQGLRFDGTLLVDPDQVPVGWASAFERRLSQGLIRLAETPRAPLSELLSAAARI